MMLDDFPGTFTAVQIHLGDQFEQPWGATRAGFYSVGGYPDAWFDGVRECSGTYTDDDLQYAWYLEQYNIRQGVATDVTIDMRAKELPNDEYLVSVKVGIEEGGVGKTVRIHCVQVLDGWVYYWDYHRMGLKQGKDYVDITLAPGESQYLEFQYAFDAKSWEYVDDITIVAWAQKTFVSAPSGIYQADEMRWSFPLISASDYDRDWDVDLNDFITFTGCFAGAGVTVPPGSCSAEEFADCDADGDGDVDLNDFITFTNEYTGSM